MSSQPPIAPVCAAPATRPAVCSAGASWYTRGIAAVNVDPCPSSLSTVRLPPSNRELARERQAEAGALDRRCSGFSTWLNSSKIRSWSSGAMPMPVSATEKTMTVAVGRRAALDPDLAALGELERVGDEVAQDLRDLALVGVRARDSRPASSKTSATGSLSSSGRSMPRRAPNRSPTANSSARTTILPASTLARSSRSLTSSDRSRGGLRMKRDLLLLLGRQLAVDAVEQQPGEREDRVQRRAELVAHVGQEARLHLVGAAQVGRLLVELGVERDDAAVGVLQLAVEPLELVLALAQLPASARSSSWFCCWTSLERVVGVGGASSRLRRAISSIGPSAARPAGSILPSTMVVPRPGPVSISNWSIRRRAPTMPRPMPVDERSGRRGSSSRSAMPGPRSLTRTSSSGGGLRPRCRTRPAAAGVLEGVARDLGDGGGDAGLVLARRSRAGAAIWRARWRASTTSCSVRIVDREERSGIMRRSRSRAPRPRSRRRARARSRGRGRRR